MLNYLKNMLYRVRQTVSFLLALILTVTGIQVSTWADGGYNNYLDGWKVSCAWSILSNDYTWDADCSSVKQPKIVVTYRLENAEHAYEPGDIQFDIPGIGNGNRASILKASDLASDAADSEWSCTWNKNDDIYTFSNKFSVETGQSVSGGFQMLWTMQARKSENGYYQKKPPVFRIAGTGQIEMEPLSYSFTSIRDRYRINMKKNKLAAADYEESDHDYIWYEIETRFDKDWLARGLCRSNYFVAVELPEGKRYSDVKINDDGKILSLEEITTKSGQIVWGFYPFQNHSGDIGSQYSTYYDQFQIGFLKDHFMDEESEEYCTVTIRGHLDRLYHDESEWITEAGENEKVDDEVSFTVADYSFARAGYIYEHSKWNSSYEDYPYSHSAPDHYSDRMNAVNIYNGKVVPFILRGISNRNYASSKASSKAGLKAKAAVRTGSDSNASGWEVDAAASSIPLSIATESNAKAEEALLVPEFAADWNDIHWRKHGLTETDLETMIRNSVTYDEIHPEPASDSNASYDWEDPDREPYVPDVTIWGSIQRSISGVENGIRKIGELFVPLQTFAAATDSTARKATNSTVKKSSDPSASKSAVIPQSSDDPEGLGGNTTGISQIGINGNADRYSLVMGDDKLAIFLTDGSVRNLEDDEYDIAYITMPSDSKGYDYEVYGADAQDTPFSKYIYCGSGNTSKQSTIQLPAGMKAMFVRVNNITGSYHYNAYVGVRLHLDWETQQQKAAAGEAVPDRENRLVNFSYLRSLYKDPNGYEVNDCAQKTESYAGTYGRELAERDMEIYDECVLRGYSNVWLRSPITKLISKTALAEFTGSNNGGFTSTAASQGSIKADDSGSLESFSLYTVIPDGLSLNLDTDGIRLTGSGTYYSGDAVTSEDFESHVSYSLGEYNGKTMLIADFDFSDTPLEISKQTDISISFAVTLKYADFISCGNYYTVNSYLMVHDDGLDQISGAAIMADAYDINGNGIITERMAYSGASKIVLDSASEWREYVSKYVKSIYSNGYETEAAVQPYHEADPEEIKSKSRYSYRLDFGLGSDNAKNIDFFDHIEQGARVALNTAKPDEYTEIPSAWQGNFVSVDTSYAEKMKLIPTVYYSTDPDQEFAAGAEGWSTELPDNPGNVKSIWIHLDTSNLKDGLMKTRQMTYVIVNMQAPSDKMLVDKKAVNQYYVQFDAYGIGSADNFEARYELPSAETYVKLMDTIGKITLQKVDADHLVHAGANGSESYAALTGGKFQVYDRDGNAMFEDKGQELNALGQIVLTNVPYGTYQWEELEAPKGYQKINGRHSFEINGVTEILNIPNHRIPGKVILTKYDQDDSSISPLADAEFELFRENGDQVFLDENMAYSETGSISRVVTGADGAVSITNLPWGNYQFIETKAPRGYELSNDPVKFTIGKNQFVPGDPSDPMGTDNVIAVVNARNNESPASIRLIKKDSSDGRAVKNAVFSLYRKAKYDEAEDKLIQSGLKTNAAGELQVDNLTFGEYYFVETKNPAGYVMPSGREAITNSVILDQSTVHQILEIVYMNDRMKGNVILTKLDDAGQLVSGAGYTLMYKPAASTEYAALETFYQTDAAGEIRVSGLEWGDYYFIESKAPRGYELSDEHIAFTLSQDTVQSTIYVEATDQRQKGSLKLIKVDADDRTQTLTGAEYELYRTDGTKCIAGIDYVLPEGMDKLITGEDGTITITGIAQGGYYLLESAAPESYSLSDEKIRFSVTKENADVLQEIAAEDVRNKATLKINKVINEVYVPFGDPTFIFRIEKKAKDNMEVLQTYYKSITLSSEQREGHVNVTVDQGYYYQVTELNAGRYKLAAITADTDNIAVEDTTAAADLLDSNYAEVTFENEINQYEKLSHTVNATNIVKTGVKLTGIRVEYHGPDPIDENTEGYDAQERVYTISTSDLTVSALYDDGTSYEIPAGSYTLSNPVVDGGSNSHTGIVIYKEAGVERTGTFSIHVTLPEPLKRYWVIMELDGGTIVKDGDSTMTAVDTWVRQIKEGSKLSKPANNPKKPGYRFIGWYEDAECRKIYNFAASNIMSDTHIYAKWEEDYDVKYAVAIYAINDTDADGTILPLTFGPASGENYRNTYASHTPSEEKRCIHDMTWEEIIVQARKDPTIFSECLENGCTHSVLISMIDENGKAKAIMGTSYNGKMADGDGATNLLNSIYKRYRAWNRAHSTYYETSSNRYKYGTNEGGWPDSAIRNMLNGVVTENMLNITNKDNGFEENMLSESTALISCFPQALQNAIYPRAVRSDVVYDSKTEENVVITRDKLWLLSSNEYFANSDELPENYRHPLEAVPFKRQTLLSVNNQKTTAYLLPETGTILNHSWLRSLDGNSECYSLSTYYIYCTSLACYNENGSAPGFSIK